MTAPVTTLIGDVVDSRGADDRADVHHALQAALTAVNEELHPLTPLRITVGDEYQGAFATLGAAVQATLRLRLAMFPYDVRHGLGRGAVEVLSEEPRVEDGPAWWAARAAIEEVHSAQRRAATQTLRTWFGGESAAADVLNAALTGRDEILAGLDAREVAVLSGMIAGVRQDRIARDLGISASAVSQRVRRAGLGSVLRMDALLGSAS